MSPNFRRAAHQALDLILDALADEQKAKPVRRRGPTIETDEAAETILAHGVALMASRKREVGTTFAALAASVLDERELEGLRGVAEERSVFKAHLSTACFAGKAIDKVSPSDVARWLRDMQAKRSQATGKPLSRGTIQRALSLASAVFVAAGPQGRGLLETNPCAGMRVRTKETRTEEPWTFLTLEEQAAIRDCQAISLADRLTILFAIGTGLRQGEQFNLELRDLHVEGDAPHVVVRFGSKGKAPKNGRIRTVPLFGVGLAAARAWLRLLPSYAPKNPEGLAFPSPKGHRRARSKPLGNMVFVERAGGRYALDPSRKDASSRVRFVRVPTGQGTHDLEDRFQLVLWEAGITRHVRWHDLRHTCASSLVSGFWGEPWSLPEVREMLGHSSVTVTERYAHLAETALKRAVAKVSVGGQLVGGGGGAGFPVASISNDSEGVEQRGIEPLTSALRTRDLVEILRALTQEKGASNPVATHLAEALVTVLERGQA